MLKETSLLTGQGKKKSREFFDMNKNGATKPGRGKETINSFFFMHGEEIFAGTLVFPA